MTSDNLRAALAGLAANAGALRAFEPEVRAAIGNTNWEAIAEYVRRADAALASPSAAPDAQPVAPDMSAVICPACAHQFRAIPVDVQQLMLDAGFEPPFTAHPQQSIAEHVIRSKT